MQRTLISLMLIGLMVLAGCGREEPAAVVEPTEVPDVLVELELPLNNPGLGITLSELPSPLVASWSDDDSIMLVDSVNREHRYFLAAHQGSILLEPERYFEDARLRSADFSQGTQFETGVLQDAPFGLALWSASRYELDDENIEEIELMSPHPSGQGILELRTTYPQGSGDVQVRVQEMRDLLARVQATSAG